MSFFKHLYEEVDQSRKKLRDFGILFAIIFKLIAIYLFWSEGMPLAFPELWTSAIWFGSGSLLLLISFLIPGLLKPFYIFWMMLALVLGFIMTRIIISIVYYLIMTPIGVYRQLRGSEGHYHEGFDPEMESYWTDKEHPEDPVKSMEKQY